MSLLHELNMSDLAALALERDASLTKLHYHNHAQLSQIINGTGYVLIENKLYTIPPGMAIYIPAKTNHQNAATKTQKSRSIYFASHLANRLAKEASIINLSELASLLFKKIITLQANNSQTNISIYLECLILELNQAHHIDITIPIPKDSRLQKVYYSFTQNKFLNVTQAADIANLSIRSLSRLFLKDTGINFLTWKHKFVVNQALVLLPKHQSTSFVSYKLGYSSETAFINMFKKITGGVLPHTLFKKD